MRTGKAAVAVSAAALATVFVMSGPRPAAAQLLEMMLEHAATTAAAHAAAEAAAQAAAHAAVQGAVHAAVHGAAHAGLEAAAKAAAHGAIHGGREGAEHLSKEAAREAEKAARHDAHDRDHDAHDRVRDPRLAARGNQDVNLDQSNDQPNPLSQAERGPNRCNRAVGQWGFSNGAGVTVNPGGGLFAQGFLVTLSGTWTCRGSVVTMKWPEWTDHYAIMADGNNLSGVSGYNGGTPLTASRK